jgi:hypothetical protein
MALELIKVGKKELNNVKLFIIAKRRRVVNIRTPILIRIQRRYKSSPILSKSRP